MSSALSAISKIAQALRRQGRPPARSTLRLEDTFRFREPMEDAGGFLAKVYESSSKLLLPRRLRREGTVMAVGLDSTTRRVEAGAADVVVGSAVSYCSRNGLSYEWPSLSAPPPPIPPHPVYVLLPNGEISELDDPIVSLLNPAGERYDIDYSADLAEDEVRSSMESWMLSSLSIPGCAVLLDGPVYQFPRAFATESAPVRVRRTLLALLRRRLEAISALESRGVPVIGVVKRVERSTILSNAMGMEQWVARREGDASVLERAFLSSEREPGRVYVTPKVGLSFPSLGDLSPPPKLIQYVVVPAGKYQSDPLRIYRLEFTFTTLRLLEERRSDPLAVFLGDSLLLGSQEPVSIRASDRRASEIAEALKRVLAASLVREGALLSYWGWREVT
ncbi:MAG: DNA double-strand break repair nuclease NurA [Acidilobaceae archaeon]|nr:DNA double-strand break repair nuclease NurA [Acidilobaceae archaeon]MCX8165302.1 DNA double-strand break repair nuclease NurA [Acidilobaceae archaeon]MDW7973728.1 DNA double-strand break repair nuclease NurA [Sulfolobales archaeon]